MDDLQFKNTILEAKLASKQAELDETNNKLNRAESSNAQIDQHKQTIKVLEKKLAAAEKQITQLQNGQITDVQKSKISRCDWLEIKFRDLEKSEPQQRIDSLAAQLTTSQNNHRESLQELWGGSIKRYTKLSVK